MTQPNTEVIEKSSKSYGVAVSLCGVFGMLGIHHFYLGNWLHGLFDVGLIIATYVLLYNENPWGMATLLIDLIHTFVVFYLLIVGKQKDAQGRLVSWQS